MACHSVVAGADAKEPEGEATMCAQKGEAAADTAPVAGMPSVQADPALWPRLVGAQSVKVSADERIARGRAARTETPRSSHRLFPPSEDRRDPVGLLEEQSRTRVQACLLYTSRCV